MKVLDARLCTRVIALVAERGLVQPDRVPVPREEKADEVDAAGALKKACIAATQRVYARSKDRGTHLGLR